MGSCSTKIKLSDDDKRILELNIDDKANFVANLILCQNKTTLKKDKRYLQEIALKHLERTHEK